VESVEQRKRTVIARNAKMAIEIMLLPFIDPSYKLCSRWAMDHIKKMFAIREIH
jgi:hypothetical protein